MKRTALFSALLLCGATPAIAQTNTVTTNGGTTVITASGDSDTHTTVNSSASGSSYSYSSSSSCSGSSAKGKSKSRNGSSTSTSSYSTNDYDYGDGADDKAFDKYREKVEEQLITDQLIKKGENWSFAIDGSKFTVNGKKMGDDVYQRYKQLYENTMGKPLGKTTAYAYSWSK